MTLPRITLLGALALCIGLGLSSHARAAWSRSIETSPRSGVSISLALPVNEPPNEGRMPCFVTIVNGSGAARTWTVNASSANLYGPGGGSQNSVTQSIRVANQATARVPILLPLWAGSSRYYRRNTVEVSGPGVVGGAADLPTTAQHAGLPYIAMGAVMATPLWESLKKERKDAGGDLNGSPLNLSYLGADWRGLTGYDSVWLTGAEYTGLDPDQRRAIRDWVDRGGKLFLFTPLLDPALRGELGLPEGAAQHGVGFGSVTVIGHDGLAVTAGEAALIAAAIRPLHDETRALDASAWGLTRQQGNIRFNAGFLILFIALFAVLVGPVNLFWLAGPSRRHRLFWTTPLISVAASLVLIVVIVVQDGFGGHGSRLMVTRLFPAQKKAVVVQEQVARTGVLLLRRFTMPEDVLFSPVSMGTGSDGGRRLSQAGRDYAGDWFASRSVQAHRLETIVPSRAEVQLVNVAAAQNGAPPEVVSSIPGTLKELHYVDAAAHRWGGTGLRTGERVTLRRESRQNFKSGREGSEFLSGLQMAGVDEPESFYAEADDGPFVGTLPSIRWTSQHAVYLGPVTEAP